MTHSARSRAALALAAALATGSCDRSPTALALPAGEPARAHAPVPPAPDSVQAVFHLHPGHDRYGRPFPAYTVVVDWAQPGGAPYWYRVLRHPVGQPDWWWTPVAESFPPARTAADIRVPLSPGAAYDYVVKACNTTGGCAASAAVRVTTTGMSPPPGLTVVQTNEVVRLEWGDVEDEERYFVRWRADTAAAWTPLVTTGGSVSSYLPQHVAAKVTNYYQVAGMVGRRIGPWSSVSLAAEGGSRIKAATGEAAPVSIISVSASGVVTRNGTATRAWFEWGPDPALHTFSSSAAVPLGFGVGATPFSFTITVPSPGTYYYRLAASNAQETVRGAIRAVIVGPPAAPALTAAFSTSGYQVNVSWAPADSNAVRYRLYRRQRERTTWTLMQDAPGSVRTFVDREIPVDVRRVYLYEVAACNAKGECTASGIRRVDTTPMPIPSGLTLTYYPPDVHKPYPAARLEWRDLPGNQAYLVQWRTPGTAWQNVVTTGTNVTYAGTRLVTPGTTNEYRVAGLAPGARAGQFTQISVNVP